MIKTISKLRLTIFTLLTIQLSAMIVVTLFYIFDWYGFREVQFINAYVFAGLVFFILLDEVAFWVGLIKLNHARQKNDLEAASLIGSDIQEAYEFGKIGLLVTDDNDTVMWTNSLFKNLQIDIIDENVFNWTPALKSLVNAPLNKILKTEIKGRKYEVKYLSEPRLFIFKDVTDYENSVSYSKEQRIVLGLITIDNLNEVTSDTDESADTVTKVRSIITDYCRDYGVLLRRVKNDTYFAVCNYSSLKRIEDDKFSLLEAVRQAMAKESNPLTLSIGFAYDFPDVEKLNEMVADAIDVALSRGGDQAVVSQYGKELRFFGGKTAAIETTSKVKVRSVADSLIALIKSAANVYVMGHTDMDMDALGSCLGILAIADYCHKDAKIIYDPRKTERKARLAFQSAFTRDQSNKMTIAPDEAYDDIKPGTLLVIVDVAVPNMVMAPEVLEKASKIIIIDHHRRGDKTIEQPVLSYIEPSASSASELIVQMIKYATANPRIELKPAYATIMLSGIFLDSNYFKSKSTGMRTFEAAETLKEYGADNGVADDYLKDEFEEYSLITKIISTIKTPHYGIVYCTSDDKENIERSTLAKVANQILQLKGINACFVIGRTGDKEVRISARSDGTVNVQLLCEKMGGGGHFTMAACVFNNLSVDKVVEILNMTLDEYLDSARVNKKEGE